MLNVIKSAGDTENNLDNLENLTYFKKYEDAGSQYNCCEVK